ncbi:MAG: N-acetyltransferase family protein [Chloroflexota bacterium]
MNLTIRRCTPDDLETLRSISRETYDDTFRAMNTPETMQAYLEEAFDPHKLLAELTNPHSAFYFLDLDGQLAGYLKLNDAPAQSDLNDPDSLEIERIYIRRAYHGRGLGARLLRFALDQAAVAGKRYAWLGVWERNASAIAFYQKMGFVEFGRHSFRMGEELQSDLVMRCPVPPAAA